MDRLYKAYGRLLAETDLSFTRYLYEKINWDNSPLDSLFTLPMQIKAPRGLNERHK